MGTYINIPTGGEEVCIDFDKSKWNGRKTDRIAVIDIKSTNILWFVVLSHSSFAGQNIKKKRNVRETLNSHEPMYFLIIFTMILYLLVIVFSNQFWELNPLDGIVLLVFP